MGYTAQSKLTLPGALSPNAEFLLRLQSPQPGKYKRYNDLPLRYAGGKSLAVGYIMEQLPDNLTRLVSPFTGGASFEIACARELGIEVLGYDIFDILVNYWQLQLQDPQALAEYISRWQPTKTQYQLIKQRLKEHWAGTNLIEDELELAAHYWFNHNLSYGPGFLGWMSSIYECTGRYQRLLAKVRDFSAAKLKIAAGSFEEVIPQYSHDFLYCDPPYYLDGDSKMFRGIYPQRNFPVHHQNFRHELLHKLLTQHKGGFILSYNDCSTVRSWYADCQIIEVSWQYTLGQGETRIGKNRQAAGSDHIKKSHELLIVKYA